MSSIEPVNSKALSNPRSHEKVATAMNVWSNAFFKLTLPSNLGSKASIKQIQNEDAKVFSMGNYIGHRIAQQDAIPYDGCTYEVEPACDKTQNTLWGYPVQFPDDFKQSNGEKFNIPLGITFKCHACRGMGRVTCRNCGGKVRWEKRRGDKIVNYTCNCGDGKQNCNICTGFGQMQKILCVQTSYQFDEKKVKNYSGRVPENLLLNAPGDALFKYISDFENRVLTEVADGLEAHKFERLMQDLRLIIKHEFDTKVASRLVDLSIFHNFINNYFDHLPNLVVTNKRLEQESIPVKMKCEVISVPIQSVAYHYKGQDYSLYVYGNENRIWIEGKTPSEFTWKLGVFLAIILASTGAVITGSTTIIGVAVMGILMVVAGIFTFVIAPPLAEWFYRFFLLELFFGETKRNLNRKLAYIQNLISNLEDLARRQYLMIQSELENFYESQSEVNNLTELVYESQNSFLEQKSPLNLDIENASRSLQAIVSCNDRCNFLEATDRKSFIENEISALSPLLLKAKEVDAEIAGNLTRFKAHESSISSEITSIRAIEIGISEILDKVSLLRNKWSGNFKHASLRRFKSYDQDVERLNSLNHDLTHLRQEHDNLNKTGIPSLSIDGWKGQISRIKSRLNLVQDLERKPHITGAGFFGGRNIEWGEWPRHVVIAGASRSGKSLTIEMLTYPILRAIQRACQDRERKYPLRAVMFDVDGKTVPQLQGIGFREGEYFILNPFDTRRWGWATGQDIISHDDVLALVNVLLPLDDKKQGNDTAYWIPIGRKLLLTAINYLIDSRGRDWVLWDLFKVIFYTPSEQEKLFEYEPSLKRDVYLDPKNLNHKHFQTVLNTISSNLSEVEGFAALWYDADYQLSIRDFLQGSGVLVIPEHGVKANAPLRKINTFILEMIGMFGIDEGMLPDVQQPNTWIVVDEATRIAPIPRFDDFLTNGLKRGISVIFGFQSYYKAQQAFGEKELEAILEQCTMAALLRMDGKSAEWASEMCRSYWGQISSITLSKGNQEGTSFTKNEGTSSSQTSGGSSTYAKGQSFISTEGGSEQLTRGTSSQFTRGTSQGSSNQGEYSYPLFGLFGGSSGDPQGWGTSHGSNESTATGTNSSFSRGNNWSSSQGTSENWSEGTNWNETEGTNSSEAWGENSSTSNNVSVQISPQKLKRIEPDEFSHMPETSPESGLTGVFLMRDLKTKAQTFASKFIMDWELLKQALIPDDQLNQEVLQYRIPEEFTRELLKKLKQGG